MQKWPLLTTNHCKRTFIGNMRPLVFTSLGAVQRQIARRAVAGRLARGWTRGELAERSGIAVDTLKRFEQTGQISLVRLLKIAVALDSLQEFSGLFQEPAASSLDELETHVTARRRIRARGRRAQMSTPKGTATSAASSVGLAGAVVRLVKSSTSEQAGDDATP